MSKPDWDFWLNIHAVTVLQACALSLDIDPGPDGPPSFASQAEEDTFKKRLWLLASHIGNRAHFQLHSAVLGAPTRCKIYLSDFATWAVNVVHWNDLPDALVGLARVSVRGDSEATKLVTPAAAAGESRREAQQSTANDWRDSAREIAEELFCSDTKAKFRDTLDGYARRVMERMQKHEIHSSRGRITNANTIKREALQGPKWWAKKIK